MWHGKRAILPFVFLQLQAGQVLKPYLRQLHRLVAHELHRFEVSFDEHQAADERCLARFNSDTRFAIASGQSLFLSDAWSEQLDQCVTMGSRYVLYSHGLVDSQNWARGFRSVGPPGKKLMEIWGTQLHTPVLEQLNSMSSARLLNLSVIGVCVPNTCLRRSELLLGWHVLLLKLGHPKGALQLPAPIRSRVRLRASHTQDALRASQLKSLLEQKDDRKPSWYLNPSSWRVRPARSAFASRALTQYYFRFRWSLYTYRMHVSQKHRYALCSVPKVGLMQFFLLDHHFHHRNVTYEDIIQPESRGSDRFVHSRACYHYWRSPTFKFVAFVRDPLERFLSAFLDKCMQSSRNCETDREGWEGVSLKSSRKEQIAAFRLFAKQRLPSPHMLIDDHWIPQSIFLNEGCRFTFQRVDFVGLLTADRNAVNWQVFEMLHAVFGFSLQRSSRLADEYFPGTGYASEGAALHTNTYHDRTMSIFSQFYNQDTLENVLRYTAQDYAAFGFRLPAWTEGITNRTSWWF
ncbi:unnamed protein product [Symbiodinium sp. CCMP2456]|nr:unnamed protein product [Symbiodinium sp. CCMP2456]